MPDQKGSIQNFENKISKELYGVEKSDNFSKDLGDIESAINKINQGNAKFSGSNIIEFLSKMEFNSSNISSKEALKNKKRKMSKSEIEQILSKDNLNQLMDFEKERIGRYDDYNLIYSYIPQLAECINVLRDCIMSPDDLTKDSINVGYKSVNSSKNANADIIKNLNYIVDKYELNDKAKHIIQKTLIAGDNFVAVLKYDDEFNKMLLNEDNDGLFVESEQTLKEDSPYSVSAKDIEIDEDFKEMANVLKEDMKLEAKDDGTEPQVTNLYSNIQKDIASVINNNIEFSDDPRESLINVNNKDLTRLNKNMEKRDKDNYEQFGISGSIIRLLKPENVIKLEVDGINFGYIHIERSDEVASDVTKPNSIGDFFNSRADIESSRSKDREDVISGIFIKGISKKIDNEAIKKNKEFKDYIYLLLKERYITDKSIKITYLTPDEVVHFMTDKDEIYGQSKLSRSLFFAKLYLATLITELMQKISRGRDKRLVYVETGLDDDIEGVIQGVVKDIKSKEIQTDVLKSITTILNSIGAFDDYYIPLVDGEKPLDFDTLQGMDVSADDDFLQFLLKSAINGTTVPMTYVDSTQEVDFAKTLAMQNSTFVRTIVSDQASFSKGFSQLMRMLYRNEFMHEKQKDKDSNDTVDNGSINLKLIEVLFPAPVSLNLNNVNDQISNSSQTLDFITNMYIDETDSDTNKKLKFRQKIARELLPNIDWDKMDELYEGAKVDAIGEELKNGNPDSNLDAGDDEDGSGGGLGNF